VSESNIGRAFDAIPGGEIKTQKESYAVQPCKIYFCEPGIRGRVGTAAGGRTREKEKKKRNKMTRQRKKEVEPQWARKGVRGGE